MTSTGSSNKTCHEAVIDNGSFGETLAIINGDVECVASPDDNTKSAVKSRLNTYCKDASQLELNSYSNTILLNFDGCTSLHTLFDECVDAVQSSGIDACTDCMSWAGKTLSPTRVSIYMRYHLFYVHQAYTHIICCLISNKGPYQNSDI